MLTDSASAKVSVVDRTATGRGRLAGATLRDREREHRSRKDARGVTRRPPRPLLTRADGHSADRGSGRRLFLFAPSHLQASSDERGQLDEYVRTELALRDSLFDEDDHFIGVQASPTVGRNVLELAATDHVAHVLLIDALEYRRALLATFLFAGLRIGELTDLRWRDVDLPGKRLLVQREAKTDAGVREVDILAVLRGELASHHRKSPYSSPGDYVFPSAVGTKLAESNIRRRVLDKAIAGADKTLTKAHEAPLPDGLTPHKLRHTFASILVAIGVDPGSVMDQLGHADPGFTLRIYRHGMRRDQAAKERLRLLVGLSPHP